MHRAQVVAQEILDRITAGTISSVFMRAWEQKYNYSVTEVCRQYVSPRHTRSLRLAIGFFVGWLILSFVAIHWFMDSSYLHATLSALSIAGLLFCRQIIGWFFWDYKSRLERFLKVHDLTANCFAREDRNFLVLNEGEIISDLPLLVPGMKRVIESLEWLGEAGAAHKKRGELYLLRRHWVWLGWMEWDEEIRDDFYNDQ
jgi:uncharacterized membrane protein